MRLVVLVVLVLVLGSVFPLAVSYATPLKVDRRIEVVPGVVAEFDKFSACTRMVGQDAPLLPVQGRASAERFVLTAAVVRCGGNILDDQGVASLMFTYRGREWRYLTRSDRRLVFVIGDERIPINDEDVLHTGKVVGDRVIEIVTAKMSPILVRRLIECGAEGRLGMEQFDLSDSLTAKPLMSFAAALRAIAAEDSLQP